MGTPASLRVLLVIEDADYARVLQATASDASGGPWIPEIAASLPAARERLTDGGVDVVLLDLDAASSGVADLGDLCRAQPTLPVVVLTKEEDPQRLLAALQAGAQDYLVKGPIDEHVLSRTLRYAVERKSTAATLRQLEKAVSTMPLGVTITDVHGLVIWANRAEAEMHGYSLEELMRLQSRDLSPRENWQPMSVDELRRARPWKRERIRLRKDGSVFPAQLTSDAVLDAAGEPLGLVTTCEDITERWRAEEALRESQERYTLAARGTNDGLWDWNLETGQAFFSLRWKAMLGHDDSEIRGGIEEWFSRIHPDDRARVDAKVHDHLAGRTERLEDEHRLRHKDGTWRWILVRGSAARGRRGRAYRMAGGQTDVTDRRAHDPLTRLPNRAVFEERLAEALARARRRSGPTFAVLFVDVDHFKGVNDTYGHVAGDLFLTEFAQRLLGCIRPGDLVARFAGDEFAILLERIQSPADAIHVAERVLGILEAPVRVAETDIVPSASVGVALGQPEHERPEDVLRDADAAMYRAKDEGRGRWTICDHDMRERLAARARVREDLRHAVDRGELEIRYEPVVEVATGRPLGFEALLLWRGVPLPLELLAADDQGPAMMAVESWLLKEATGQAARWSAGLAAPLPVTFDVSVARFLRPQLAVEVKEALAASGLPASALALEIGEEALLHDDRAVTAALDRLAETGAGVVLDRYGTGPTSLAALRRPGLVGIKLDASLFTAPASLLLRPVLDLARVRGLPVTAIGVGRREHVECLRGLACERAQGSYFSEPLDAAAAEAFLDPPQRREGTGALRPRRNG